MNQIVSGGCAFVVLRLLSAAGAELFQFAQKSRRIRLAALFVSSSAENIPCDKENNRAHYAKQQSLGGLQEHHDPADAGQSHLIDACQILSGYHRVIVCVVGDAPGNPCRFAVLLGDLHHGVGDNAGAVACRVKKGDHVSFFDILRFLRVAKNQVAALYVGIHGIRHHNQGEDSADAGNLVGAGKAAGNQGDVNHQYGQQNHTDCCAENHGSFMRKAGAFSRSAFLRPFLKSLHCNRYLSF